MFDGFKPVLLLAMGFCMAASSSDIPLCQSPYDQDADMDEAPRLVLSALQRNLPEALEPCLLEVLGHARAGSRQALAILAGSDAPTHIETLKHLVAVPVTATTAPGHLAALARANDPVFWQAWVDSVRFDLAIARTVNAAIEADPSLLAHWPDDPLLGLLLDNRLAEVGAYRSHWRGRVSAHLVGDTRLLERDHGEWQVSRFHVEPAALAPALPGWMPHHQALLIMRVHGDDLDDLISLLSPDPSAPEPILAVLARHHESRTDGLLDSWRETAAEHWASWLAPLLPDALRGPLDAAADPQQDPEFERFSMLVYVLQQVLGVDEREFLAHAARHPDPDVRRLHLFARLDERPDTVTLKAALEADISHAFMAARFTAPQLEIALSDLYVTGERELGGRLIAAVLCERLGDVEHVIAHLPADSGWQPVLAQRAACRE